MKTLILILMLLIPSSVLAANINGNQLLGYCNARVTSMQYGFCLGYIRANLEYRMAMDSIDPYLLKEGSTHFTPFAKVCFPDGLTLEQMVNIFVKKMKSVPERTHESAVVLLMQTQNTVFPCESY